VSGSADIIATDSLDTSNNDSGEAGPHWVFASGGGNLYTWTGATDTTWADQTNWDIGDGSAGDDGFPDDNADVAHFNSTADNVSTGAARTLGGLLLHSSYTGTLTLGGILTLDDAGVADGNLEIETGTTLNTDAANDYDMNIDGNVTITAGNLTK